MIKSSIFWWLFGLLWIILNWLVEEVVGLEPTHVGFAIRGITSFAIPPTEMYRIKII